MTITDIARACHEANRQYCLSIGDDSQVAWEDAPEWQKESATNGVLYHVQHPNSTPSDSHENWLKEKQDTGWKYGPVKDVEKREHPCFVPYEELPENQKVKDAMFLSLVRTLEPFLASTSFPTFLEIPLKGISDKALDADWVGFGINMETGEELESNPDVLDMVSPTEYLDVRSKKIIRIDPSRPKGKRVTLLSY